MSRRDRDWAAGFVEALQEAGLHESVMWKINCRADEVEQETFAHFQSTGLFLVYLGLESGNETGLRTLNKQITVRQNREAVETLKELGLRYEFGFMLFDPSSTFDLVRENVGFLREICGDGSSPAPFCKMLPYAGTDIEETLREQGRLRGDVRHPDYGFGEERVDRWFSYLSDVLQPWIVGNQSLLSHLRWAWFEMDVLKRFYTDVRKLPEYDQRLTFLTARYNEIFFRVVEESAAIFEAGWADWYALQALHAAAEEQRRWLGKELDHQRGGFFAQAGLPLELVECGFEAA
jgi:hypothetical protein